MKLNADKCHFIISGNRHESLWKETQEVIKWAAPEKTKHGQVEDMEFSGVLKKQQLEFPGVN